MALLFLFVIVINFFITPSKIKNLPIIYTTFPILNGLEIIIPKPKKIEDTPCIQFYRFSKIHGDVYQIFFGTKLVVVANSYESIKLLWCSKNVKGNNSRPVSYSFHKILSNGVYTIGTTPIGESYKKSRKHINETVLCEKKNNNFNFLIMDKYSNEMIDDIITNYKISINENDEEDNENLISSDFLKEVQYFHLKLALFLTYGFELNIHDVVHKKLANEIIDVENKITKVRSHIQNFQDYLPIYINTFISLFSNRNDRLKRLYETRESYLQMFYNYSRQVYDGISTQNITTQNLIESYKVINKIEDFKNTLMFSYFNSIDKKVNLQEITSECLTMVSAGLDNTPLTFKYGLHQLVNYHSDLWDKAFKDLIKYYNNDFENAYNECSNDMKSEYVKAIVQETLRLFTVLPMALPRETTNNIFYQNAVIRKGTILFMNCWAGNHDKNVFPEPMKFIPERWLITIDGEQIVDVKINHFSFGIGSRKCLGNRFAFRELYILFAKLILYFEPITDIDKSSLPASDPLALNQFPDSLAIELIPFEIRLKRRVKTVIGDLPAID
jgi:phenylacetate 2-hydroxylase